MFGKIKKFLTSYNANEIREITDRPMCCLIYRLIQLCISAYIILLICKGKLYLKTDPPIPGAVRLTLREPNNFTKPSYCVESSPSTNPPSCAEDKLPCVYWGAKEIQYPIEETGVAFFTTRASVIKYPQGTCNILASSPEDACIINNNNHYLGKHVMNSSFIADIENYTVMIEHSIASIDGKVLLKNRLMDGQFLSADDKTIIKSWSSNDDARTANQKNDGDILTMKEILDAAGADLSACSSAPGANKDANESNRSSGIIIVIVIHYEYYQDPISYLTYNVYNYKYKPRIIDDAEYKIIETSFNINDGSYTVINRHGIRLVFNQHGSIRSFSWTALIINVTASLYSFRVASLLMDLSIRNRVDIKQSCKNIYTWFKGIFGFNGDNDNEESVPLIRTAIF